MKRTAVIGLLLLDTVSAAAALTNDEVNKTVLTVPCPQRIRTDVQQLSCATAMRFLVDQFVERGYVARSICPPEGTVYGKLVDIIEEYLATEKPLWTKRAVDVAHAALMRRYPCR
jgi:hypothetical protein